jgi:hypothetical protein
LGNRAYSFRVQEAKLGGSIFLENNGNLIEMKEAKWDAEERLQELLAKYPNLLAGDQMNELAPREWLFVSREFGIPGEVDAGDRWSLDHLFLDQDAIPTLVEVKRGTDTRIRREVVGQMLDYASNLATNVSGERIRQRFEASIGPDSDPAAAIAECFGEDFDVEGFWAQLQNNIAAGKLRLVFVADEFPQELRRIVEFLNRQMQQTDVFAVEVKQFVSPDEVHRTLVPRLLGKVESKPLSGTNSSRGARWTKDRFNDAVGPDYTAIVAQLIQFGVDTTGRDIEWGTGKDTGSATARLVTRARRFNLFSVYSTRELSINVGWYWEFLDQASPGLTEEFRGRVNQAFAMDISKHTWERAWPMIPLSVIQERWSAFTGIIRDLAEELKAVPPLGLTENACLLETDEEARD